MKHAQKTRQRQGTGSGGDSVRGIEGITVVQTPLNGFCQPASSGVSQSVMISSFGMESSSRRIMSLCWDEFCTDRTGCVGGCPGERGLSRRSRRVSVRFSFLPAASLVVRQVAFPLVQTFHQFTHQHAQSTCAINSDYIAG